MKEKTFSVLIPAPEKLQESAGVFPLKKLTAFAIDKDFLPVSAELEKIFSILDIPLMPNKKPALIVGKAEFAPNAWQMKISPDGIEITAGDICGANYAVTALAQMLFAALITGDPDAALDCVSIYDSPRFAVRSFLLDSARQFQNKEHQK